MQRFKVSRAEGRVNGEQLFIGIRDGYKLLDEAGETLYGVHVWLV